MAALQHGRGKQSFRDFQKSLNAELRDIREAVKSGEEYTSNDIIRFINSAVNEYVQLLRNSELDVDTWTDKAIDLAYKKQELIIQEFELKESAIFEEEAQENYENEEIDVNDTEGKETLLGYPVINKENKELARSVSEPRKRFFLTVDELQKYVEKVPYIRYIQIVRDGNGKAKEYRVWVEKPKKKKRRKSKKS